MMITRRHALRLAFAGAATLGARPHAGSAATNYPSRPIRLVVPWAAGGGTDFFARLVAPGMTETIGRPVIVENRPGAASNLGAELVAGAPPDGHTILLGDMSTYAINPTLYPNLPFDPARDFVPISLTVRFTSVLLSNPRKLKASSVAELVATAKAEPRGIVAAHVGVGSPFHLANELFQRAAGITLNQVAYRGAGPAIQGLLSNDAHFMFVDYASARPHVAAGSLRALAVAASSERPQLPGVLPVAATAGLAGFEVSPWQGLVAPAGTPPSIIARLHEAYGAAIRDPGVRQRLAEAGAEPLYSTAEDFTALRQRETAHWAEIIRVANIRIE